MEKEDFDAENFFNHVWFYRAELMKIRNGAMASDVMDPLQRRVLRKRGVIDYTHGFKGRAVAILTPKALAIHKTFIFGGVLRPDQEHDSLFNPDDVGLGLRGFKRR